MSTKVMVEKVSTVEVRLPVAKIRIDDLSYLRGLAQDSVRCRVPDKAMHRLIVLGLAERYDTPPCPDKVREFEERRVNCETRLRAAIKPKSIDWNAISGFSFYNVGDSSRPTKGSGYRITEAGQKLIRDGSVHVTIGKSCK